MLLVTHACDLSEASALALIPVPVERHKLARRRWRGTAKDGTDFGIDVSEALVHGSCIHKTDTVAYVIEQSAESCLLIPLGSSKLAAWVGWMVGNLHFKAAFSEAGMLVQDDLAVERMLDRAAIQYERVERIFEPGKPGGHCDIKSIRAPFSLITIDNDMLATRAPEQSLAWVCGLLQVSDSLFPSGAYAHSMGLEQWAKTCAFGAPQDLLEFFKAHAGPALSRQELPYLRFVREALSRADWRQVQNLDAEINAWKWSSELRAASISQGRGRFRLLATLWPKSLAISRYAEAFEKGNAHGHHIVVAAIQFEIIGVPLQASLLAYAYQSLANYISASIKLLRISPQSAQAVLRTSLEELPQWVEASLAIERDAAGWFAPAFEIACARHASAFSRLFIS